MLHHWTIRFKLIVGLALLVLVVVLVGRQRADLDVRLPRSGQ